MSKVTEELTRIREILEEGQSGGGGGDSDLSLANVTFKTNDDSAVNLDNIVFLDEHPAGLPIPASFQAGISIESGSPLTVKVPLYKGIAFMHIPDGLEAIVDYGSAEVTEFAGAYDVTISGDCTLKVGQGAS